MVQQYKHIRFPSEAYPKLVEKQSKIIEQMNKISSGRKYYPKDIPFTKILTASLSNPLKLNDDQLYSLFGKRRRGYPYAK